MSDKPGIGASRLPGLDAKEVQTSRKFLTDNNHLVRLGVRIEAATNDNGNVPVTKIRGGHVLVALGGGSAGKWGEFSHADSPGVGLLTEAVILMEDVNMLGKDGVAADQSASALVHGFVKESEVIFDTIDAGEIAEIKGLMNQVTFKQ